MVKNVCSKKSRYKALELSEFASMFRHEWVARE